MSSRGPKNRTVAPSLAVVLLLVGCGDGPFVIDARRDAEVGVDAATPPPMDGAMPDPDAGTCVPATLPAWVPYDTMGPDGEGVLACAMRVGALTDDRLPIDQSYELTTFGGPGDAQPVSCAGAAAADGSWYYAANGQRFRCGQRIRLVDETRTKCVIVEVADVGPNACVEEAGRMPLWDVSPLAATHLYGVDSAGWSDHLGVHGAPVDNDNPLGPCDAQLASRAAIQRGFIGGACASAADCPYADGLCMSESDGWPGGTCSSPCDTSCPDLEGPNSFTACVDLSGTRRCVARCDFTLHETGCRAGYACERYPHPTGAGADRWVCVPSEC